MTFPRLKASFAALTASTALSLGAPAVAADGPHVNYTHPQGTYLANGTQTKTPITRTINCGNFHKTAQGKLFFTPEVLTQIDVEGAKIDGYISKDGKRVPEINRNTLPPDELTDALSRNTVAWFSHLAEAHAQCRAQYQNLSQRVGIKSSMNTKGWETQTHCPPVEVVKMCKQAMEPN